MTKRKDFKYLMSLDYGIVTYKEKYGNEEYFVAEIPELKGCSAHGNTVEEAIEELKKAKEAWIKSALADGEVIPLPEEYEEFSGKLILRINPRVHKKIAQAAEREKVSLNGWLNKAIQERLAVKQETAEIQKYIETLKQEILTEFKIQVGELRKSVNMAITERQDFPGMSLGNEWSIARHPVMTAGSGYTLVGSPGALHLGSIVGQAQPMRMFDPQFNSFFKSEEAG